MNKYLIEFRFFGKAKYEIKQLIGDVDYKFYLRRGHKVPHISLVGPFYTQDERRLISDFKEICSNQEQMQFEVDGFNTFEKTGVVFLDVKPDKKFDEFRWMLSKTLQNYCNLTSYDIQREFNYHATIAMKLNQEKVKAIKNYIDSKPKLSFKHILMRVTLIKNHLILCEYDFLLKKLLNRNEAKNSIILSKTFDKLKEKLNKLDIPINKKQNDTNIAKTNIDKINTDQFSEQKIFFISDNHFDHKNIIKYQNRPFKSTLEMNEIMLRKWNDLVKSKDVVFFLGDLAYGKHNRGADYWLEKLNGQIYFIKGNHEIIKRKEYVYDKLIIEYKGQKLFLVHDPKDVPSDWNGWAICGHHHNNKPREFPLVNKKTKKINVSVELLDYKPIEIEELLSKTNVKIEHIPLEIITKKNKKWYEFWK